MLRCNACWSDLEGKSVVTACQHLFCLKCAQQIVESDSACPVCENAITKSTVKVIQSLQDASACQLLLCGQAPETAFASALTSVQFYLAQQQMQAELREAQLTKKMNKLQEEVHNGYVQAKRKYEEATRLNQQMQQDNQELQAKYAQKAMQARKLQEMLKKVQQDNENIRHNSAKGGALSNGGGQRSMSPLAQPGHMVTTVQRTQVFADLHSPPGVYGNGMQQQPTGGRVQGITGGYRMPQAGPTGSGGNGGGFLGGSLDPNSPSVLAPLNQGLRRSSSGGGGLHLGGGGATTAGQDPHNNALRKMLGMPTAQNVHAGRGAAAMRNDLFSM
ncbi:hypothetical protein TSOC_000761 [Tetrabaena socialis]|uniref:RING-type domain-containing protein n=1 Tax=Tetrabaena socialis TaxID=47790 RepID=A0A2J8AIC4_9CHLO|nr:hypothetical protein TSOC_000761 [Tetrabaena socialis]|eukprot:PNH12270.1 hypothetical protein TSOC_000761 [Tetrabaena socialis]